jgi:hypothetical protein
MDIVVNENAKHLKIGTISTYKTVNIKIFTSPSIAEIYIGSYSGYRTRISGLGFAFTIH